MTLREQLEQLAEPKYRDFSARLLPPGEQVLGVRLPVLRRLARGIAKQEDWRAFVSGTGTGAFEEDMLRGMVIGCADCDLQERLQLIRGFIPRIRNWSVCDSFCAGLKFTKENREAVWAFLKPYFHSGEEFSTRFACVMLLTYYLEEENLERDLAALKDLRDQPYFAMMAAAWSLSLLYVRYPKKVACLLRPCRIDEAIRLKAIQKILESTQLTPEEKKTVRALKQAD